MTVKELYKKYEGYQITLFGKPLNEKSIPFTHLPKDKDMYDCEVVDLEVNDKEKTLYVFDFNSKSKKTVKEKGTVMAYIK